MSSESTLSSTPPLRLFSSKLLTLTGMIKLRLLLFASPLAAGFSTLATEVLSACWFMSMHRDLSIASKWCLFSAAAEAETIRVSIMDCRSLAVSVAMVARMESFLCWADAWALARE